MTPAPPPGSPPPPPAPAPGPAAAAAPSGEARYGEEYFHERGTERIMQDPFNRKHFERFLRKLAVAWPLRREAAVLDLGCAVGYLTYHFGELCAHVTGVDHAEAALEFARRTYARPNVEFLRSDILEFAPTRRYDLVLFVSLYEHLTRPQQDRFLERLKDWLAPGGVVVTHTITADSWLGRRRTRAKNLGTIDFSGDPTHTCVFGLDELYDHYTAHGYHLKGEYRRYGSFGLKGHRLEQLFHWLRVPESWRRACVLEILAVHGLDAAGAAPAATGAAART